MVAARLHLAVSAIDEPQDQRKNQAQYQTRRQRKIKSHVLAAINNVTGQTSQRQVEFAGKEKDETCQGDHAAHHKKKFSQVDHSIILSGEF